MVAVVVVGVVVDDLILVLIFVHSLLAPLLFESHTA